MKCQRDIESLPEKGYFIKAAQIWSIWLHQGQNFFHLFYSINIESLDSKVFESTWNLNYRKSINAKNKENQGCTFTIAIETKWINWKYYEIFID